MNSTSVQSSYGGDHASVTMNGSYFSDHGTSQSTVGGRINICLGGSEKPIISFGGSHTTTTHNQVDVSVFARLDKFLQAQTKN